MKRLLLLPAYLLLINLTVAMMLYSGGDASDAGVKESKTLEPSYAPLEEKAGKYCGTVYDASTKTDLCEISFFGHTSVGGVRKESDDSMNKLDLKFIKEIMINKADYESKRYADKSFSLVSVIADTGARIDDMLVPKHVIICGKESKTNIQKSWFLNKVSRVVVKQPMSNQDAPTAKEYVQRILKTEEASIASPEVTKADVATKAEQEDVDQVKKELDEIKRKTEGESPCKEEVSEVKKELAEIKKQTEQATRDIAEVKQNKDMGMGQENQPAMMPTEMREKPLVPEPTVKDAFVQLVTSIVEFGKSIVHFVIQLFPV